MESPAGMFLECRPSPTTASTALKSISYPDDKVERMRSYLNALEAERKKIEAFKRELPFCMQLLHDAIEASKEQLAECRPSSQGRPQVQVSCNLNNDVSVQSSSDRAVLEEFLPLKRLTTTSSKESSEDEHAEERICRYANEDKPSWMTVTQVWYPQAEPNGHRQERCSSGAENTDKGDSQPMPEQAFSSSKLFLHSKQRSGGAFLPFSRDKQVVQPAPKAGAVNPSDLALSCGDPEVSPSACDNSSPNPVRLKARADVQQQAKELVVHGNGAVGDGSNVCQPARKARRCWSPELHRRFVSALQQLGGSQVATPKQIRELMKVEGLTNDEVKSHLQKYRLHTRRPSPSQSTAPQTPQLVVLGGIWVPPEYAAHAAAASQQTPSLYNSAQQPHLCQASVTQEFYSQLGSPEQRHLQSSVYCDQQTAPAHSQSSPQGPLQSTGQSSAGIHGSGDSYREESVGEDGKSESSSWKQQSRTRLHGLHETEDQRSLDGSINESQSQCTGEYDTDIEDSRGSETSLKM